MKKVYSILLYIIIANVNSFTQSKTGLTTDDRVFNMKDDTVKVNRLNSLASKWQFSNPDSAIIASKKVEQIATKLNYNLGLAIAFRIRGAIYAGRQIFDSARMFYDKAYLLIKDETDKQYLKQIALLKHNYGTLYQYQQEYDSASKCYFEAIKLFENIGEEGLTFYSFNNLIAMNLFLKDNQKALEYATKACGAAEKLNNPNFLAMVTNNKISALIELKKFNEIKPLLIQNKLRLDSINNFYAKGQLFGCFEDYYREGTMQYDSSIYYGKLALDIMRRINNQYESVKYLGNIGYTYLLIGQKKHLKEKFDSAYHYCKLAKAISDSFHFDDSKIYIIGTMIEAQEGLGNIDSANALLKEYIKLKDTLQIKHSENQVKELEKKYETEKKDIQIQLQQASIKQKNILNYVLAGTALGVIFLSFISYRNYKHRRTIQQQRITELETEKQLTVTESVLQGEEKERTRIAKDLHDSLGGMLSGIKYSLNNMKGNLIMTPDNAQAFERSMDMLDNSIKEMRRVAHNMMPEALMRYGLDTALKDFSNDINNSGIIKVVYQPMGMGNINISQSAQITIYRVVQELINNAVKHASASQVLLQVFHNNDKLILNVEDNGKGFNADELQMSKGIGWQNIQSRVDYLKGKIDLQTQPGKGTIINIELRDDI